MEKEQKQQIETIKITKAKIEHLIKNLDPLQEYNSIILNLIFNFSKFIEETLSKANLGIKNLLSESKIKYIDLKIYSPLELNKVKNEIITKIKKCTILNNVNKLRKYMDKINKETSLIFYQSLSCIYGAFYGDCFKNYELSKNFSMTIFLALAIMDSNYFEKINIDLVDYYYLLWFIINFDEFKNDKTDLKNNFREYNIIYLGHGFISEASEKLFTFRNSEENEKYKYDDFLTEGFLTRISPFVIWYYIKKQNEIKITINSLNFEKLKNLFEEVEKEARSILKVTDGKSEFSIIISFFTLMCFGTMSQLNSNKIIQNIKILIINYKKIHIINNSIHSNDLEKVKILIQKELNKYDKYELHKETADISKFFTKEEMSFKIKNTYRYEIPFRLTLYYLYHINNYKIKNQKVDFDKIMNEIYSLGGNVRENAAIVGTIIGPMVGYKNFDKNFKNLFYKINNDNYLLSPSLMVIFIYYLLGYKNKNYIKIRDPKIYFKYNIIDNKLNIRSFNSFRMILNFLYNEIKFDNNVIEKTNNDLGNSMDAFNENVKIQKPKATINSLSNKKSIFEDMRNMDTKSKSLKKINKDNKKYAAAKNTIKISSFNFKENNDENLSKFDSKLVHRTSSCLIY